MAEVTTLFVGGLPQDCPNEEVHGYFSQYGECKADVKVDPTSGRSRGFGYIEFSDPASADAVLANVASHTIRDKWVDVKPYTKGGAKGGAKGGKKGGAKGGYGAPAPSYGAASYGAPAASYGAPAASPTLFVGGIPAEVTQEEFQNYFSTYGSIKSVELKTDPTTGRSRGFGFVEFDDAASAASAIANKASHTLHDKWVDVKAYEKGAPKGAGKGKGGKGKGGKGKGPPQYAAAAYGAQSYAPTYGARAPAQSYAPTYGAASSYGAPAAAGYGGYGAAAAPRYAPY